LADPGFAVEAEGLSFSYTDGTRALHGVDFCLRKGEFTALLASNGSGKTTLIKVLGGLAKPQKGTVRVFGQKLGRIPKLKLYQTLGIVFQNPSDQLFAATVGEDVAFGPRNLGLDPDTVDLRVSEALEALSALHLRERAIHHLSFGEQKRVAIAGVLAMNPSVLILDEPTAGLDPSGEELMVRLLQRLNREGGLSIVFATHSIDLLPLCADTVCVLNLGAVLCRGPARDVLCNHEMLKLAGLRLPYVSSLLMEMKDLDGVPIEGLPLTVKEARERLLEIIPPEILFKKA
jgi:cobalt/nickel transport system ATP-binding protein